MDALSFARPSLLWGLLAVGLPVLIHLLGRRRVRTVPIATLRFLERARTRAAARWRLRRILLLLARAAALGCLALLFAGPGCREQGLSPGPTAWVFLLDTSPSMAASRGGPSCLEQARRGLEALVDRADPRDRFLFVTTWEGGDGLWRRGFTSDAGAVRRALEAASAEYGVHRTDRSLERAYRLLQGVEGGRIALATDLQASGWGEERVAGAGSAPLRLIDVGLPSPANTWVASAREEGGLVRVKTASSGPGGQARRTVRVRLEDGQAAAAFTTGAEVSFRFRTPPGVFGGEVLVEPGGDLSLDDRAAFVGRGSAKVRLLLVNGDPRGFEIRDELFFVRRALAPGGRLGEKFEAREVSAAALTPQDLDGADVALLANPGPLSPPVVAALRARAEAGLGLLITAGDRWKPGEGMGALAAAAPASLRDLIAIPQGDASRRPQEALDADSLSGPLADFRDRATGDLARVRVWAYWVPETRGAADTQAAVLMRLENGAPLLLDRPLGKGRTLLLTTTLDRDGSDLCLQPAFIPWLERVLLHAAGRLRGAVAPWVEAGRPAVFPYREAVTVKGPGGYRGTWKPGDPPLVPPAPGLYRILQAGGAADAFAAGVEPAESDLTRLTPGVFEARTGAGAAAGAPGQPGEAGQRDASPRWAAGLLAALALEALLSARWRTRRKAVPVE